MKMLLLFIISDLDLVQDVPDTQTQEEEEKNMKCKYYLYILHCKRFTFFL